MMITVLLPNYKTPELTRLCLLSFSFSSRGKEWRPVKMDNVSWDKRSLRALRIDQFKRIPGSALDLSQYVKKYDIDRNGRLKADADGDLYFENAPGEKVRLRGFNFTPVHGNTVFTPSRKRK